MKVLQINSVCGYGSTGKICTDIYDLLIEQGHDCCIAYGRNSAPQGYKTIKIGNRWDNYFHVFLTRIFDLHGFGSRRATKKLIKDIREYDPDIIHLHNIHGYFLNIEILFKYLNESNKKVVWTLHDCWSFTGHCSYFTYANCNKWQKECIDCPQKKEYPSCLLFENSRRNFIKKKQLFTLLENLTIVTPSKWLADLCKKSFLSKYPIEVINNGIDTSIFKKTDTNFKTKYMINEEKFILGLASVFNQKKGFNTFLKLREDLNSSVGIVLIGLNKKQIKNLPTGILGISRTENRKELVEAYNAADIFINPTLEDNYPTTNLEAIACHTPVITNNVGGCIETISKDTGVVVDNYENMLNTINQVLNNEINFDFKTEDMKIDKYQLFKKYIELYERVL